MHSRRYDRFLAPPDVHVTINPQSGAIPGFLIDIGPKGAGIEYIPYTGPLKPNHNIEIIFKNENLGIDKLPCKTIYDFETEEEYNSPVQFRKVGVQFQGLTDRELNALKGFLFHKAHKEHRSPQPSASCRTHEI